MEQSQFPAEGGGGRQAPAGWYKDPTTGRDRYWDGYSWGPDSTGQGSNVGALEICGYVFAVLFSIVGLILGIISTAKGNRPHGPIIIAIAAVFMVLGAIYYTSNQ